MLPSNIRVGSGYGPSRSYATLSPDTSFGLPGMRRSRSGGLWGYLRKLLHFPQMDFEFALWQMLYICIAPRRVYRNISHHKQTKNQWARDDPAFVVLLSLFLTMCAIAYGLVYKVGFVGMMRLILYMVLVDFLLVGVVVATFNWFVTNRMLNRTPLHSTEQAVEWAYAFDVHCNSFFPMALITYVLQFCFLSIINRSGWLSAFVADTMYLVAASWYCYVTFLGYSVLPFLKHTTLYLYPIALLSLTYLVLLVTGMNIGALILRAYFGE